MKVGVKLGTVHTNTYAHNHNFITTTGDNGRGFHTNNHTQHNTTLGENHYKPDTSSLHCTLAQHQRHRATAVQEWNVWVMIIKLIIMC